ncbi:hypothetical protein PtB15_4B317 [Puccinia triticina]|nr:hypothetical protein PtB15_4B317 [Puccinia triticina]
MHPDNLYAHQPPDFDRLIESDPSIERSSLVDSDRNSTVFKDPEKLRQLTCALLLSDFNLKLSLPPDRLCPIIPGRLDYCLWLIDVVKASVQLTDEGAGVLVIDIGTGSSAIYPLLLSRLLKKVRVIATEIDQFSYDSAVRNVTQNDLLDRVTIQKTSSTDPTILPTASISPETGQTISITMCNPPFYSSQDEIDALRAKKDLAPEGVCTGSEVEMVYPGGEVGFIEKMMKDSLVVGSQTRWFTSLCGKYTTLLPVVQLFKSLGGNNYAISELIQGRTKRWVIGWSWQPYRLPNDLARTLGPPGPRLKDSSQFLPPSNHIEYYISLDVLVFEKRHSLIDQITNTLEHIAKCGFAVLQSDSSCIWNVSLVEKNWTRNARRKRKFLAEETPHDQSKTQAVRSGSVETDPNSPKPLDHDPILKVTLSLIQYQTQSDVHGTRDEKPTISPNCSSSSCLTTPAEERNGLKISIDWLFGQDRDLFLSFWNHVLKKLHVNSQLP